MIYILYRLSTLVAQATKKIHYWLRLAIILHDSFKQSLLHVLHNKDYNSYKGLPDAPSDLYTELSTTHKQTIDNLLKNNVLKKDQLEILLPTNGDNKTYSDAFDVTLLVVLIENCTTLPPPTDGWEQIAPPDSDTGIAANVLRVREFKISLYQTDATSIDESGFNMKWAKGIHIIKGLGGRIDKVTSSPITNIFRQISH